ncbi:MAG: alpha/beta hydrolase, partial [Myxococcota bacterium]
HDWGAAAAYIAAALFPDKLRRLFALAIPHPGAIRRRLRKAGGVRHFLFYKMPGAAHRFAKDEFAALEAIYRRWSPSWEPSAGEFDAVRETFANRASLDSAMGYYRSLPVRLPNYLRKKISVDTVVFAGADDPVVTPTDYFDAKHMFTGDYKVEVVPGGHFLHREHPERFAEQLLAHFS